MRDTAKWFKHGACTALLCLPIASRKLAETRDPWNSIFWPLVVVPRTIHPFPDEPSSNTTLHHDFESSGGSRGHLSTRELYKARQKILDTRYCILNYVSKMAKDVDIQDCTTCHVLRLRRIAHWHQNARFDSLLYRASLGLLGKG